MVAGLLLSGPWAGRLAADSPLRAADLVRGKHATPRSNDQRRRAKAAAVHREPGPARAEAPAVCAEAAVAHPFVFTQVPTGGAAEKAGPPGGLLRRDYGDRSRLMLARPDGAVVRLAPSFHSACDPSIGFDAETVLFAGKRRGGDDWNIYELRLDGGQVRRVTRDCGNCRAPLYQSTLYTIVSPEPWRQISFTSDMAGTVGDDGRSAASHLYSCRLDGSDVRRLTFNVSDDLDPILADDGRIILSAHQRSTLRRGPDGRLALFGINLDGTDYALFADPRGRRAKHMPCISAEGRLVFVESDRPPWDGAGQLSAVNLRRPLLSYHRLTGPEDGLFHSPAALPDGSLLVARRPGGGDGSHGLYRLDLETGRRQLVFDDPAYHDIQPAPLVARPRPDGRSSVVRGQKRVAKLYCLDVDQHELPSGAGLSPGSIARIRVVRGLPRPAGTADQGDRRAGRATPALAERRILAEVDVADDGSFVATVPAEVPLELHALDHQGMAVRTCGWIWAMRREPRGCIGCHEDPELTPKNVFVEALETSAPPRKLTTTGRAVDFRHDIAPIVREKCVVCHGPQGAPPRLDAAADPGAAGAAGSGDRPSPAYRALLERTEADRGGDFASYRYVHPGQARTSPLVWHLFGRNTSRRWDAGAARRKARPIPADSSVTFSGAERRRFVEWIDLGAAWDRSDDAAKPPDELLPADIPPE